MRSSLIVRALLVALALADGARARANRAASPARTADDFGDTIGVGAAPQRIVSLNPVHHRAALRHRRGRARRRPHD